MAVLRDSAVLPGFPQARREAWRRAGLAHNAKLHIPLTRPAAASAVQSVPERFWTWTATDASGQVQPVCTRSPAPQAGLAALAVADGPATWASRVAALRPELSMDPAPGIAHYLERQPWAGESYSALTVEMAEGDDELIAAPAGPGTHRRRAPAGAWSGLMEGALRSGARAASEVLAVHRT